MLKALDAAKIDLRKKGVLGDPLPEEKKDQWEEEAERQRRR